MPLLETDFDLVDLGELELPIDVIPPIDTSPTNPNIPTQQNPLNQKMRYIIRTTKPVKATQLEAEIAAMLSASNVGFAGLFNNIRLFVRSFLGLGGSIMPKTLSTGIRVEPLFDNTEPLDAITRRYYVLILPISVRNMRRIARGRDGFLFDIAYKISTHAQIEAIEPDLPLASAVTPLSSGSPTPLCGDDIDSLSDPHWARERIRHTDLLADQPHLNGTGYVIGHLDTGHKNHPELSRDQTFLKDVDGNFIEINVVSDEDPTDATDRQPAGGCGSSTSSGGGSTPDSPHGTATASVICSMDESTDDGTFDLIGIAPGAKILPVRCLVQSCEVISLYSSSIARAFAEVINMQYIKTPAGFVLLEDQATTEDPVSVDVISVSFGGYMIDAVWDIIMEAVKRDIIVVTAAGNYVPWVVEPAAFPHCIAVAGTTMTDETWNMSSLGPQVDLSAPALCVVHAAFDPNGMPTVIPGAGTSHAAPAVAAAATLWLQHFGRDALKSWFPDTPLQFIFRCVLQMTARTPEGWDRRNYGAGILDVQALIDLDLTDATVRESVIACLARTRVPRTESGAFDPYGFERPTIYTRLARLFPDTSEDDIRAALQVLFQAGKITVDDMVDQFGIELLHFFTTSDEAREAMFEALDSMENGIEGTWLDTSLELLDEVYEKMSDAFTNVIGNI